MQWSPTYLGFTGFKSASIPADTQMASNKMNIPLRSNQFLFTKNVNFFLFFWCLMANFRELPMFHNKQLKKKTQAGFWGGKQNKGDGSSD